MSSLAEPVKHSSEGDAPNPKKTKLDDNVDKNADAKNLDNNNGTSTNPDENKKEAEVTTGDVKETNGDTDRAPNNVADESEDPNEFVSEGADSDDAEIDPQISKRLQSVETIQQQISKLNELASEEILKVEQKFNKLRRPHFEQRNALLKDVPNFWVTCLNNHPTVNSLIENAEEDCLHYLVNLDVEELEDIKSGYNLKFHFRENPYIKNELIVRELRHLNSDLVISKSTPVEYKDTHQGRSLKSLVESRVGQINRTDVGEENQYSFFAWLCLPCETGSDDVAEIIKDQIWPSPLEFFLNSSLEDYDDNSDDEDEEDDESDEGDYDEDDFEIDGVIHEGYAAEEDIEGEELDDEEDDGCEGEDDGVDEEDEDDEE